MQSVRMFLERKLEQLFGLDLINGLTNDIVAADDQSRVTH